MVVNRFRAQSARGSTDVVVVAAREVAERWEWCAALAGSGFDVVMAADPTELDAWVRSRPIVCVLLDVDFVRGIGTYTARLATSGLVVVVRTRPLRPYTRQQAQCWGAKDVLGSDEPVEKLLPLVGQVASGLVR